MYLREIFSQKKPSFSLEIFPPRPDYPLTTVYQTVAELRELAPDFISVTYGAGGSNRARTIEIAATIKKEYQIETVAHLTCVGHSPNELEQILDALNEQGIKNVLALRGDPPQGVVNYTPPPEHYQYATQLVAQIRKRGDFSIGAAAYPEGHKEATRWTDDWCYLKEKVDAGVDFLTTQLFFDNRVFYNFLENIRKMGISVPVVAGIMPILNAAQIKRMIFLSEASIPSQLFKLFDQYGNNNQDFEQAGIEYAVNDVMATYVRSACGRGGGQWVLFQSWIMEHQWSSVCTHDEASCLSA